ncbi:hypothetical protein [uncultured Desulfosarcina sp.]|uniref:hypothetical protein n=1 Tax=uncultured Desulfosarcina sp. TaxID=218289 RepID=UPI0029C6BBA7|nr:hypothetical protein [uncultured Desulfosarcina sp.]
MKRKEIKAEKLRKMLKDYRIILDCGHKHCQHNFSNTMVITAEGKTLCHNCYL